MTYRKGYPDLDGPLVGTLQLETTGIVFVFEEEEIVISFEKIENVMEPAKGDFPDAMKSKAFKSKMAGKAGKLAKEFTTVHAMDCRNPNEIMTAEITGWRVQKITLHPQAAAK